METILFIIVLILIVALILAIAMFAGYKLHENIKKQGLTMIWARVFIPLIALLTISYLIYCFVGMIASDEIKKANGNVCKGYKYGIKICSGDINAE